MKAQRNALPRIKTAKHPIPGMPEDAVLFGIFPGVPGPKHWILEFTPCCAVANLVISEEDKARINATSGKQRQHDKDRFFAFNYNPGNLEFKENK